MKREYFIQRHHMQNLIGLSVLQDTPTA